MKYSLLLLSLLLLSSCMKQESNELYKNKDAPGSISEKISYHSGYEIHHEKDGSTTLIAGSEKNTCPPGMHPKWLDGCVDDPSYCPEWQTLTGFAGTAFCAKSDDTRSYYERLWSQCAEDSFWYAGCIASITHMQSRWYRLALSETCAENFKIEWYTVVGWLTWCAPSDTYYQKLRASCAEDSCCLSSVNTMEQWRFIEASDGKCTDKLAPNMQRCPTSKTWCQYDFLVKDFWSGFTLEQTDDETILSYSGKVIKTWSHTPPKEVPFVWDEACDIVRKKFEILTRIETTEPLGEIKQRLWDAPLQKDKRECMKEYFWNSAINVEAVDTRFYRISRSYYEWFDFWIYDTIHGNIQRWVGDSIESISSSLTGISLITSQERWEWSDTITLYDSKFSQILSQNTITDINYKLEKYIGNILNKKWWIILKNIELVYKSNWSNYRYEIYTWLVEPKYCKPQQLECEWKKFLVIMVDGNGIYFENSSWDFECKNTKDVIIDSKAIEFLNRKICTIISR